MRATAAGGAGAPAAGAATDRPASATGATEAAAATVTGGGANAASVGEGDSVSIIDSGCAGKGGGRRSEVEEECWTVKRGAWGAYPKLPA